MPSSGRSSCWVGTTSSRNAAHGDERLIHHLLEHLGEIASILFFLMGAMTIVELVDVHEGFRVITDRITSTNKVKLLWIICIITFFLSAALDNLTTAIVMCALLRKLIKDKETLWTLRRAWSSSRPMRVVHGARSVMSPPSCSGSAGR